MKTIVLFLATLALLGGCRSSADDRASTTTPGTSTTVTPTTPPTTAPPGPATPPPPPTTPASPPTAAVPAPATTDALAPAVDAVGTVTHESIIVDGLERTYRLYVPSVLPDRPVPLFIALHGGTGWGDQFAEVDRAEPLAEANGFIVVHPDGVKIQAGPGGVWNGGVCCGVAARDGVDDVAFVRALIDELSSRAAIDESRIGAFGHSNGAILSYRLACELADRITAVGLYAGTLGIDECAPSAPVSLLHLHGDADRNIPIDGGRGTEGISRVDFPSPRAGFNRLAAAESCPAAAVTTVGDLTTDVRTPSAGDSVLEFVTIAGANHMWAGGTTTRDGASGPPYAGLERGRDRPVRARASRSA